EIEPRPANVGVPIVMGNWQALHPQERIHIPLFSKDMGPGHSFSFRIHRGPDTAVGSIPPTPHRFYLAVYGDDTSVKQAFSFEPDDTVMGTVWTLRPIANTELGSSAAHK